MTPVHLHIAEGVLGRRRFQWQNPSLQQHVCQKITIDIQIPVIIRVSLSEPHTRGIALHTCMCVFACLRPMQYSGKDLSLISNLLVHDKSFAKPICCLLSLATTMFYIFQYVVTQYDFLCCVPTLYSSPLASSLVRATPQGFRKIREEGESVAIATSHPEKKAAAVGSPVNKDEIWEMGEDYSMSQYC